jgi:hypothetical protein
MPDGGKGGAQAARPAPTGVAGIEDFKVLEHNGAAGRAGLAATVQEKMTHARYFNDLEVHKNCTTRAPGPPCE